MEQKEVVEPLNIDMFCTKEEYRKAYWCVMLRVGVLQFWPIVLLTSVILLLCDIQAVFLQTIALTSPFSILLLTLVPVLPAGYFLYGISYVRARINHYWRLYRHFGENAVVSTYRGGIVVSSPAFHVQIPFVDCRMLVEKKTFFLIIQSRKSFFIIPKRHIAPEKYARFSKFLRHAFMRRNRRK